MPRYVYRCAVCNEEFILVHMMNETKKDCHLCEKESCLERIPSLTLKPIVKSEKQKVGEVVKDYIETTKEELRKEKNSLKKKEAR